MSKLKEQFEKNGYVIVDVLSEQEIEHFRKVMDALLSESKKTSDTDVHSSVLQHLGDEISDFGNEARQYYFHLLTKSGTEPIHHAFYHSKVKEIVEELLGPKLIVNNASILAFNPGVTYSLGWHRDIIQIPEPEIEDWLFSKARHHNSVQINLPLVEENSLWVVPGSHHRGNTTEENAAFEGSKHYAPVGNVMPGGVPVRLKAGQGVFYNNNLIHRGHSTDAETPRRTLHMGFHSASLPPTWHFYLLNAKLLTDEYLKTLDPTMRQMMDEYKECLAKYPNIEDTWTRAYNGM